MAKPSREKIENLLDIVQEIFVFCLKITIICLFLSQSLLLIPGMGARLNVALRLEGKPLEFEPDLHLAGNVSLTPWTSLTLELQDYNSRPDVVIEVNGREVGTFLRKEFSLAVKQGDIISIFNPQEKHPVKVVISKKTANILKPGLDKMVYGSGRLYFDVVQLE